MDDNQKSQLYYYSKPPVGTQSTRSQISITNSLEQFGFLSSNATNSRAGNNLKRKLSPVELIPLNEEILELYDEYQNNYKLLGSSSPIALKTQNSIIDLNFASPLNKQMKIHRSFDNEELFSNICNRVIITRFKYHYFRIKIKGKPTPIQLNFNFTERVNGLKIYLSTKAEFPTSFNAEQFIQSKYATVHCKNRHTKFNDNFLYISLHCETDSKLNIQINFGKQLTNNSIQTIARMKTQQNEFQLFQTELSPDELLKKYEKRIGSDKITKNLNVTDNCSNKKLRILFDLQSERIQKQKVAIQNKKAFSQTIQLNRILKSRAKQFIPQYREIEKKIQIKQNILQTFQSNWLQIIIGFQLGESLFSILQDIRNQKHVKAVGCLCAWKFQILFRIFIKRNGRTIFERCLTSSKLTTAIIAKTLKKKVKKKAISSLHAILNQTLPIMLLKNQIFKLRSTVLKVQVKFRWTKAQKKLFYDRFWKQLNQVFFLLLSELQNKNKQQSERPTLTKRCSISLIDSNTMSQIVEQYLLQNKKSWQEYLHYKKIKRFSIYSLQLPSQFDKIKAIAFRMKEPRLFRDPSINDMTQIIEQYALIKNLL